MMNRKIIHVDMDAFFASVEQRDDVSLRGKPIAVGFDGPRGVVSTASYEARRYGVRSAMSMAKAKRLCPELVVVPSHYEHYKEVSRCVHDIFREYTDIIEPLSLDEAFLDVTENKSGAELATDIAREIRCKIRDRLALTASAGVSYNKFLAKVASEVRKPDGMFVIHPDKAMDFIAGMRIEDFWGVGPKTARQMHRMGIFTGMQLRQCSLRHLTEVFGKQGAVYYDFARGIDLRPVESMRIRKSVGCEHTLEEDISRRSAVVIELYHVVTELVERLGHTGFEGCTLTLKVKFHDFEQITRSATQKKILKSKNDILPLAKMLMGQVEYSSLRSIRLIGLSVSNPPTHERRGVWVEGELDFK
ncbi:DNA polymerase IV [Prevotella sp. PCHR]|uniref:DNA polymerase IV n=1 Tax=Xylanibacter caecicola TaxID=2736294 RepID=A0ABX2B2A0_9BACT|nr:DNA polymerase IV [Xylanibacter caecicola]NPE25644.1 DNA polymerase IV [Xylanibacter caecicola]